MAFTTLSGALRAVNEFYQFGAGRRLTPRSIYARKLFNGQFLIIDRGWYELWRVDFSGKVTIVSVGTPLESIYRIINNSDITSKRLKRY